MTKNQESKKTSKATKTGRRRGRPPILDPDRQKDSLSLYVGKVIKEKLEAEAARLGVTPSDVGDLALDFGMHKAVKFLEQRAAELEKTLASV